MNLVLPGINKVFEITDVNVHTLVIENQLLLVDILSDLNGQFHGKEGRTILSEDNKLLPIEKNCEFLSQFIPFDISSKTLVSKLISTFEKKAYLAISMRERKVCLGI